MAVVVTHATVAVGTDNGNGEIAKAEWNENHTVSGLGTMAEATAADYSTTAQIAAAYQPLDSDLTTIAGLTATTNNFIQSASSAWASRTPTQVTATLIDMVGDSGSGGTKGLVPAPAAGDAAASKFLKADGTWVAVAASTAPLVLSTNTVEQYNSTTAQTFRVFNTRTDGSNGEWLEVGFATNVPYIAPVKNGTGTARALRLGPTANYWNIATDGTLTPSTAFQPITSNKFISQDGEIRMGASVSYCKLSADGVWRFMNNAENAGSIVIGATANTSYPRLNNAASGILDVKLGDNSAYTQVNMLQLALVDGVTAPTATVGLAKIFVDTSDGDLKIIYGDGTTKLIVADT